MRTYTVEPRTIAAVDLLYYSPRGPEVRLRAVRYFDDLADAQMYMHRIRKATGYVARLRPVSAAEVDFRDWEN